jgi:hypothetical protein
MSKILKIILKSTTDCMQWKENFSRSRLLINRGKSLSHIFSTCHKQISRQEISYIEKSSETTFAKFRPTFHFSGLKAIGRFLNQFQNLNFASSKLEVNKYIPIEFSTGKFSTWTRFKNRPLAPSTAFAEKEVVSSTPAARALCSRKMLIICTEQEGSLVRVSTLSA